MIWREFMRLGYLRHLLRDCPTLPSGRLRALLSRAPELIMADSASRPRRPAA